MKYCKLCVQPDTRPGIYFKDGVCGACLYAEEKKSINWKAREVELKLIAERAMNQAYDNNVNYDCVVGVSGGKDSLFQSLYARDVLKLHPLLVNAVPGGRTEAGNKNIQNLKNLGFDILEFSPNPQVIKKLIRKDFFQYLNPIKVTEYYLYAASYIMADKFNIPLVIQGENIALTLGASKTGQTADGDALNVDDTDTLKSSYKEYLIDGVTEQDLYWFHYDKEAIRNKGIKAIFLQYYVKEWGNTANAEFAIKHGLSPRKDHSPAKTGYLNPYGSVDSNLNIVNQTFKYWKFGFGHVTDEVCYDIRDGLMSRKNAIKIVEEFDGACAPEYFEEFAQSIDITMVEFWDTVRKFYNKDLYNKNLLDTNGGILFTPKFKVGIG